MMSTALRTTSAGGLPAEGGLVELGRRHGGGDDSGWAEITGEGVDGLIRQADLLDAICVQGGADGADGEGGETRGVSECTGLGR